MTVDPAVLAACGVILLPVLWFFGGLVFKLLWGFWPAVTAIAGAGGILWVKGLAAFVCIPAAILVGVVGCWLWQRTRIFLRLDQMIGRLVFFD